MAEPPVLAWDVGGVLLSNGWDDAHRVQAATDYGLDHAALEARHRAVQDEFERGRISLDAYLDFTVFYQPRAFDRTEIREYIFACSTANPETLEFAGRLAGSGRYRMVALNNESVELNEHRVRRFGLDRWLSVFFTSGYTGLRKPEAAAFAQVSRMLRKAPEQVVFIDDRPENVAGASTFGFRALRYHDLPQLRRDLASLGVEE